MMLKSCKIRLFSFKKQINNVILIIGGYMKKISILSLHLGYGGIEKSIVALANLLVENYNVEIACVYKLYDKSAFQLDPRVKVKYLTKYKPNREEFKLALKNKRFIKAFKEGIKGVKILIARKNKMIKYITKTRSNVMIATRDIFDDWLGEYGRSDVLKIGWEHNHYHDDLKYADNVTRCASKLDYLVLVSKSLRNFYRVKLNKTNCKCVYIPNILDSFPNRCAPLVEKRLISVGRLSKEKGYLDLLRIYNVLEKEHPDWILDIVGDGPERETLEEYIKLQKLEKKVTLHGFQGKDYIDKLLNKSSIYLMTSYTESFGIVLIEAMSHGLPCIAFSSAEGARELIDSGRTGYLIKNRNNRVYIQKVEDLMNDIDIRKRIGHESRKDVKKYNGEEVIKLWYKIIERK